MEKKAIELGVFLPIGNNGFLISTNTPQYQPTFALNRDISVLAEEMGLDYVFSMSKWRGFGGKTRFWDSSLESFSLMAGLAASTSRIRIIATMCPLVFNPVAGAKIATTIDEMSGGRFGLNLITGGILDEYGQMGVVPEGYDEFRYRYLAEWVQVVKRLWTEDRVDHDGEFFKLTDCVCGPKPLRKPHPFLICAGMSGDGLTFTARHCDYSFIGGGSVSDVGVLSQKVKGIAAEHGRTIKTAATVTLIMASTDEKAQELWNHYFAGADTEALNNINNADKMHAISAERKDRLKEVHKHRVSTICFAGKTLVGSPSTIAHTIHSLATDGDLDSVLLIFDDYIRGLRVFDAEVRPVLRDLGVVYGTHATPSQPLPQAAS